MGPTIHTDTKIKPERLKNSASYVSLCTFEKYEFERRVQSLNNTKKWNQSWVPYELPVQICLKITFIKLITF